MKEQTGSGHLQQERRRKRGGRRGWVGLDPRHHTEETGQFHEIIEGLKQPVTCSRWCQEAIALGAVVWRTMEEVKDKLGGMCRGG